MALDVLNVQNIVPNKIHPLSMKEFDDNKSQSVDIYGNSNDDKWDG